MQSKKVLIVHEDYGISYLLKKILETPNVIYSHANTYNSVEKIVSETTFDLVITDLNIEGAFTNEYIVFLKTKLPNASIIIVSEMHQEQIKNEIQLLGINEFIDLPITAKDLRSKIKNYL